MEVETMAFDHGFRGTLPAEANEDAAEGVEEWCCDSCGEMKPQEGGVAHKEAVHAAMIDPPEETWICADCVARAEMYDEDRMMDIEPGMSDRDYYLYLK